MSARVLRLLAVAWLLGLSIAPAALAHELPAEQVRAVRFDPHPGQQVPGELGFTDENGQAVTLGTYFRDKPVILSLNYFHCQNLCLLELQGLVSGLNGLPFTVGDQFSLLTVSFDSRELPADAAAAKFKAFRGYVHPEAAAGWHLLTTSNQATIDALTQAVGFNYVYDAQENDYAHPAGVTVLTPSGQVSRYLYGLDFSATDLRLALVEAAANHIGSVVEQVLLVCYHYDPISGRYTPLVMNVIKVAATATCLVVGGGLFFLWRAERR
ncbi:MAG: SCO family protein [Chloroflexota bacterium]|nr:SCO family protein [Chloroflexota bacterium]